MQATLKNINYGSITAGGDVHIGDKYYVIERDFAHCILFLRIDKHETGYQAMLSVKGPDETSVPLLKEQTTLAIDNNLFKLVDKLQLHRRGGDAMRIAGAFPDSPQPLEASLPTAIYQAFLSGDIGQVCSDFLGLLQSGKIRDLLLVISTEEEAVQDLPWEMVLPLLATGGSNALPRDNFGLVRSREKTVQAFNRQGPTAEAAPIKLLFIPALPENLSERSKMLQIEDEQKKIIDAVRRLETTGNERPRLVMEILDCANLEEIKAALADRRHDIVHISGHGQFVETDRKGILVMENEEGDQQEVAGYELGLALRSFSSIKLLVLSACETAVGGGEGSTAEQMAAVGIPAVLAMRFSVTDAGARLFTEKLYERLAYGDALTKAMHDARLELWQDVQQRRANAPQVDIPAEWFTPVLYQNQIVGPLIKPDQYTVETLNRFYPKPDFLRSKHTRLIGEGFIGRKRLLIQLRQLLGRGHHVCLHGLGGLGKTTTAEAFAHHYRQRYGYEVLLFSRGANIHEAVILEKIFSRWKSRAQPDADLASELKALLDSHDTEPEQKLQLLLDNCLSNRRTILILDNFEDVQTTADGQQQQAIVSDSLRAFIHYLMGNCPPECHVLLTTRYAIAGLEGLVTHLRIDKLTYAEQYRYLNFSPVLRQIPLAERELLHQRFDGHPRALQFLEGLLAKAPQTDLNTLVKQAEGQIFENLLLERIYDRLTAHEREVFNVASVFISRSSLAALSAVLPQGSVEVVIVLSVLRDWSLCFWDETTQMFEVHALTQEWMRRQRIPKQDRFKTLSQQIGAYYHNRQNWEDYILAKDYFAQAGAWEEYAQIAFTLESHYRLIGLYSLARNLNREVLKREISPKVNVYAQNALGLIHSSQGQYEQGLIYFQQSLAIAEQIGDFHEKATALSNIGQLYVAWGNYEKAMQCYEQSLMIRKKIGDLKGEGNIFNHMGLVHSSLRNYGKALKYFEQSLTIQQRTFNRRQEGITLNNIGQVYIAWGDYEKAMQCFDQSLMIQKEIGDREYEVTLLINMGELYRLSGDVNKAKQCFEQSLYITQQIGDRSGEGIILNNIGLIYFARNEYNKALDYFKQCLKIKHQIGERKGEAITLNNIGQLYKVQGDYSTALIYLEECLTIRQIMGDKLGEEATLSNIGQVYMEMGETDKALKYLTRSFGII